MDVMNEAKRHEHLKLTFATKFVNRNLLELDPGGHLRIRFSLMPAPLARRVDVRTESIEARIRAVNDFVEAGWEVHLNFSPVIVRPGWLEEWRDLFQALNDGLRPRSKMQAACEVIFLTHNDQLHDLNLKWNPKGEALLWQPELFEPKTSRHSGGSNVRYDYRIKSRFLREWQALRDRMAPWCAVRYAF